MFYDQYVTFFQEFCTELLGLYLYQDYIEVLVFIAIIYKALMWLKQDHTKHLVLASYSYFTLLSCSYYLSCTILFSTLLLLTPALIMFFIVTHQKQLQKNFVLPSNKYITPATTPDKNWLDGLIQSCLIASHQQKHMICILERNDSLQALLHAPFMLQVPIKQDITNLLLASSNITSHSLLWIHQSGTIQSINVSWSSFLTSELIPRSPNAMTNTYDAAQLVTQKTDAIIFEINAAADTHTIWYQGKCIKQVTVQQLLLFVKEIVQYPHLHQPTKSKRKQNDQKHTSAS